MSKDILQKEILENGVYKERFSVPSQYLEEDVPVCVLAPPGQDEPLPLVIALHGYDAPYGTFAEIPDLQNVLSTEPMLYATFSCPRGWYVNAPNQEYSQYQSFFIEDFIPALFKKYNLQKNNMHITGFSMGGFGALHNALLYPELFRSVSGMSSAYYSEAGAIPAINEKVQGYFGVESISGIPELLIYERVEQLLVNGGTMPPFSFCCGFDDHLYHLSLAMQELLEKHSVTHEYLHDEGGHDWPYWRDHALALHHFHYQHATH